MSVTAERLKAMRLDTLVRHHGGFLLLDDTTLKVIGPTGAVPKWLLQAVLDCRQEIARFLRYANEVECRSKP